MKKFTVVMLAGALLAASFLLFTNCTSNGGGENVTLTMGSWRTDDVTQITALLKEYKKVKPNVTIEFKPTLNVDYNATLRSTIIRIYSKKPTLRFLKHGRIF